MTDTKRRTYVVRLLATASAVAFLVAGSVAAPSSTPPAQAAGCRIYVASGDDVTNGKELDDNAKRYPERLLEDHLGSPGWCVYNQGKNGVTSATYISGGSMSSAYNMRPDLHTIMLGEQNKPAVDLIDSCFSKVKDHQFAEAAACATAVYGNTSLWTNIKNNYTTLLATEKTMAAQRPGLVVGVVNYPNPYPRAVDVYGKIQQLCTPLIDTMPTCTVRWSQLPAALTAIDQAIAKLNTTIKESLAPYQSGPGGWRYVYVDVAPKFVDHCMSMKVQIKTTVEHPELMGQVHDHNSPTINFGCYDTWFVKGQTGYYPPTYLIPATPGVLVNLSQTTEDMGVMPNADGHQCIADAIWEADTIDPGTTPLKWKLGYGEASTTDYCN
ncbi:hypothetical protein L2K70_02375 [Nocardioides KLBMP 9356]|uniref:SGNH/GDSL hydrolase family protein n=1 Tax=Nocardioides potassii TaxID=2911371 RepID=A0ABS9H801_9ACTN|nr:hypothetical protein [Nocardioides potassii]MCF6376438.1 hypothetical protein [Nocardioides potassii]